MKTRNIVWAILLSGLLGQPAFAADTPSTKPKAADTKVDAPTPKTDSADVLSAPITRYEISINRKLVKEKDVVANLATKLESSDAFKASECGRIDTKKKGVLSYSCSKFTCKTDELFRSTASQPGVKLLAATTSTTCPFGCKLSSTCTGGAYVTCCRIPAPILKCATGSW